MRRLLLVAFLLPPLLGITGSASAQISLVGDSFDCAARNNGNDIPGGGQFLDYDAGIAEGDVGIVWGGYGYSGAGTPPGPITAGYTEIAVNSGSAPAMGAWYKVMGATPDTSASVEGGGENTHGVAYCAAAFRGVDAAIFDQTTQTDTGSASTPDCPTITTQTDNAWVLCLAGNQVADGTPGSITSYTDIGQANGTDTFSLSTAGAYRVISTAGAEDPGTWSSWAGGSWHAITIALKPGAGAPAVTPKLTLLGIGP